MSIELKSAVTVVVTRGDNVYRFSMPVGAPLGEAYDVAFECVKAVLGMSKQAVENAENKQKEEVVEGN